jgi:large subunit ribosomal protein L15
MTTEMRLNTLSPAPGHKREKRRLGRGVGSGLGLPKYGFASRLARVTAEIRTSELNGLEDAAIDLDALKRAGLVTRNILRAKVFLSGDVTRAVTIKGLAVTKGAREAIEKAGGKVEE